MAGMVVNYRQGTTGAWLPLNQGAGAMSVSSATQFQINGAIYKYTKGSWTSGAYYNILPLAGTTAKFQNQNKPREYVQYDQ